MQLVCTWLCKRLVEERPSVNRDMNWWQQDIEAQLMQHHNVAPNTPCSLFNTTVPRRIQIGPSCGLSVVRMLRDILLFADKNNVRNRQSLYTFTSMIANSQSNQVQSIHSSYWRNLKHKMNHINTHKQLRQLTEISCSTSLLQRAIDNNYTYDGEMYRTEELCALIRDHYNIEAKTMVNISYNIIMEELERGQLLLIPYDRLTNHNVSVTHRGCKAHWLMAHGLIEIHSNTIIDQHYNDTNNTAFDNVEQQCSSARRCDEDTSSSSSWLVICSHGLTHHTLLVPIAQLVASNAQLIGPIHDTLGLKLNQDNSSLALARTLISVSLCI